MTSRVWRISTGWPPAGATRRVSSGSSGARTGRRSRVRSERDVRVAQRLMQVRAGAGGADRARPGEHLQQRVLHQVLGVLTGAGHAAGGATERIDVDRKRLGKEFLGHAIETPDFARFPIWGNLPESTLNFRRRILRGQTPNNANGAVEPKVLLRGLTPSMRGAARAVRICAPRTDRAPMCARPAVAGSLTAMFRIALALVALRILDDNFLQPAAAPRPPTTS